MKKREVLLQKTLLLLLKKGYDGVSVSDIQQEVDIARGLLYHYFKNKEELFLAVMREKVLPLKRVEKEVMKGMSVNELITYWMRYCGQLTEKMQTEEFPEFSMLNLDFLIFQVLQRLPVLRTEIRVIQDLWFAAWKSAVLNSFARGELRAGLNLESLARQFFYLTQANVSRINSKNQDGDNLYEIEKGLRDFYEIIKR